MEKLVELFSQEQHLGRCTVYRKGLTFVRGPTMNFEPHFLGCKRQRKVGADCFSRLGGPRPIHHPARRGQVPVLGGPKLQQLWRPCLRQILISLMSTDFQRQKPRTHSVLRHRIGLCCFVTRQVSLRSGRRESSWKSFPSWTAGDNSATHLKARIPHK